MLELRPVCENCDKKLPPDSVDAMICSFECTFCSDCVERILSNVCPNCGGGFCPRPVRPVANLKNGNCLTLYPATDKITLQPINPEEHSAFAEKIKNIPPEQR